jgi:DNA gyrase subunit A
MSDSIGRVIPVAIEDEVKESYLNYAMSVIVSRALPDVRDGLKPVHRRILYAMHEMGLRSDRPFKKSGRIVGDVLGKYHPHGDQSIYDALVRLAQDFSLRYPVVNGQGNFGSMDGDPPAAMRYTEAKMHRIAEEMLRDIKKETVDYGPNYDDSMEEPLVLPTAFPFLLVNGASGIAVGMATNMAPHNLIEVCQGIIATIDNPDIEILELMEYIKGPDFPTASIIHGLKGIHDAFKTGRGQITVRGRHDLETLKSGKEAIVFTEIPYQVNKAQLIIRIADLVRDKKIEGISDLRDESDRNGVRVVIEIKKGFDPHVILNALWAHTSLQSNFNVNNLALVNGRPKLLNLKDMIREFIKHRFEVITRRTKYDLRKAEEREHILLGLKIALENIDEVIKTIKESKNVAEAKQALQVKFSLSEIQAQAILDMRLQKLTSLETQKIIDELAEIQKTIAYLKSLLENDHMIYDVIKEETTELSEKFGDERRTEIVPGEVMTMDMEDLIQEEDMVVLITKDGYVKRVPLSLYKTQARGGKGSNSAALKDEDFITDVFVANTHKYILIISNQGKAYWVKVFMLPEGSRTSRGKHIKNVLQFGPEEEINTIVSLKEFSEEDFIVFATEKGQILRMSTYQFRNARQKGIIGINLEDDRLVSAKLTHGDDDLILVTQNGRGLRYKETEVRPTGRGAKGVRGISLKGEDKLVAAIPVKEDETLLILSINGYGKRMQADELTPHGRGTQGQTVYKVSDRTGGVLGSTSVNEGYEIVCISSQGKTIKVDTSEISEQKRVSSGVRVVHTYDDDYLVSIAKAAKEEAVEEAEVENAAEKAETPPQKTQENTEPSENSTE